MKRFLAGIGSLLLLGALLAGIPALLLVVAGNPIPSMDELRNGFTRPDYTGQFLLGTLLPIVAWLAWGTFAVSILTVLPAMVRGIEPPNIPGLNMQQRTMVSLLGAVLIMFTAFAGTASAIATSVGSDSAQSPSSHSAQQDSSVTASVASEVADDAVEDEAEQLPTYRVQAGDTLWTVAETQLGDGKRYAEIAELNYGLQQDDGGTLGTDHWLAGGWMLQLPADAIGAQEHRVSVENDAAVAAAAVRAQSAAQAATAAAEAEAQAVAAAAQPVVDTVAAPTLVATDLSVTIVAGDTLWDIAEAELGAGERFGEIFAASQGSVQADGTQLSNPDLILPGWAITVPGAGDPVAVSAPAVETPVVETPVAPVTETVAATAGGTQETNASAAASTIEAESSFAANISNSPAATAGGVSALLAASLLGLLGVRRLGQRRRRRAGERAAAATAAAVQAELELNAVADTQVSDDIERALRFVAVAASKNGQGLPTLFAVRRTPSDVELFFDGLTELPAPFRPINGTTAWSATIAQIPRFDLPAADPYPALVPVGTDIDNAEVLVDLERLGSLALVDSSAGASGSPARGALLAIAASLASGSWCGSTQVTLVGFGSELASALALPRVGYRRDLEEVLLDLRDAASTYSPSPDDLAIEQTRARAPGSLGAVDTPRVILLGHLPEPAVWDELVHLASRIPRTAVVVAAGAAPANAAWTLQIEPNGEATLHPAGLTVTVQLLAGSDYRGLLESLGATDLPPILVADETAIDEETRQRVLPGDDALKGAINEETTAEPLEYETRVADAALRAAAEYARTGTGEAPLVRVLGPVLVDGAHGVEALQSPMAAPALATELIAFLALNPGASTLDLHNALWPGAAAVPIERLHELAAWAGLWLGTVGGDSPATFLERDDNDTYRLHPAITTDWQLWQVLVGPDASLAPTAQLVSALKLVTGHPFESVPRRRYGWAAAVQTRMIEAIVDAAHELAERSLSRNDVATARIAALVGEKVDPASQIPVRDRLRAEDLANNVDGFEQVVARLNAQLAELPGDSAFEETQDLIDELRRQRVSN